MPHFLRALLRAITPKSTGSKLSRAPLKLPMAVLAPLTITTSFLVFFFSLKIFSILMLDESKS